MIWEYDAQLRVSADRMLEGQKCILVSESVESLTAGSWLVISKIIAKANMFDLSNNGVNTFERVEGGEMIKCQQESSCRLEKQRNNYSGSKKSYLLESCQM